MAEHFNTACAGKVQITAYCNILILGYDTVDELVHVATTIADSPVTLLGDHLVKHGKVIGENARISFLLCCTEAKTLEFGVEIDYDKRMNVLQEMCAEYLPDGVNLIILVAQQNIFDYKDERLRGVKSIITRFSPEAAKHSWLAFTDVKNCTEFEDCIEKLKVKKLSFLADFTKDRVFNLLDGPDSKQKLPDIRKQSIMLAVPEVFQYKKPPEEKRRWLCALF